MMIRYTVLYVTPYSVPPSVSTIEPVGSWLVKAWSVTLVQGPPGVDGGCSSKTSPPLGRQLEQCPAGLTSGSRGALYGAASAGTTSDYCGLIFELQPPTAPGGAWTEATLYSFSGPPDGCGPVGPPVVAANGALYGLTSTGGASVYGTLYELRPPTAPGGSWSETVLFSFTGAPGPYAGQPTSLVLGANGEIYGTTPSGGTAAGGLIEFQPPASPGGAWTPVSLYTFPIGGDGSLPTSLIAGPGGRFYGATKYGSHFLGAGTIFELRPPATAGGAWTHKVLLRFDGKNGDVPNPVTLASDGSLYGSAHSNSASGGPVYQLSPPSSPGEGWTQTILADFGMYPACGPDSPLIVRNGNIYGSRTCISW